MPHKVPFSGCYCPDRRAYTLLTSSSNVCLDVFIFYFSSSALWESFNYVIRGLANGFHIFCSGSLFNCITLEEITKYSEERFSAEGTLFQNLELQTGTVWHYRGCLYPHAEINNGWIILLMSQSKREGKDCAWTPGFLTSTDINRNVIRIHMFRFRRMQHRFIEGKSGVAKPYEWEDSVRNLERNHT